MNLTVLVRPIAISIVVALVGCGGGSGSGGAPAESSKAASSIQASSSEETSSSVVSSIDAVSSVGSSENSSSASATKIIANGDYSSDARPAFYAVLGDNAVDDQDCRPENPSDRLTEVFDNSLQRYAFAFHLKLNEDKDCAGKLEKRQRLEVKVYGDSPKELKGYNGETHYYRWKLLLPADMQVSNKFTHVFQIIGDQENTQPLITFTAFESSNRESQWFELRYYQLQDDGSTEIKQLKRLSLSEVAGRWVDVTVKIHYAENGSVDIKISDVATNQTITEVQQDNLDLFRADTTAFNRPKWGIYRDIKDVSELLKDEAVRMTDFCLSKEEGGCW